MISFSSSNRKFLAFGDLEEITMSEDLKSQESIMLALVTGLHKDLGLYHQIPPREFSRDYDYVKRRTRAEGPEFFTKTLPVLGKVFDLALKGNPFQCPSNFKRYKGTNLPRLYYGLFRKVFNEGGTLLELADIQAIKDIRQLCYLFYKYQLPYPDHLVTDAIKEFIADDAGIEPLSSEVSTQSIIYYAQEVINEVFKDFNFDLGRPKNGPGSVANGIKPWQRYRPTKYYKRLDDLVPYDRIFYNSDRHLFDCWPEWFDLRDEFHGMAKLIAVPKDSRGPRLISAEQSEFMSYQQLARREIVPHVENHWITRGQVNFTDQSINGELALSSSLTGELATLDLSKASDLLSLDLVDALFEETPIHKFLMGSRSTYTRTPLGNQFLRKFAPMGSALCFPIQAVSYFALLVGALRADGVSLGDAARMVHVYGDDIIVPTEHVPDAIATLEAVGLKVNYDKSCFTGQFRESCGVDAMKGINVTPIKIKKLWTRKPDVQALVSWLSLCNNLFAQGYWYASDVVRSMVDGANEGFSPLSLRTEDSPLIGYTTWSKDHVLEAHKDRMRWHSDYQCWQFRGKVLVNEPSKHLNSGWRRLLRIGWEKGCVSSPHPLSHINPIAPFASATFTDRNAVRFKHCVVTETLF